MGKLATLEVLDIEEATGLDGFEEKREEARRRVRAKLENRSYERRKRVSVTLIDGSKEMGRKITECLEYTEVLNKLMETISDKSKVTTKNCEAVDKVVNELEKSSKFTKEVSNRTREKIISLRDLVGLTVKEINYFVEKINDASKRNSESSKIIKELKRKSNDVGDMILAVSDIADQTNLLALNAAIEAARAGDHGKGFAVVADEVRNLAEVADRCACQIKDEIQIIQNEVEFISNEISRAEVRSSEQTLVGNTISQDLSNFEAESNKIVDLCNDILISITELSQNSESFKKDLEDIVASAQESTTAATQIFNSVQEQVKGLTDIQESSDDLSNMAYDLSENSEMGKHATTLAAAAEELSATITESDIAAQEIMSSILQISQGSKLQIEAAQEGSDKISDFNTLTTHAGKMAQDLNDKVVELKDLVASSKEKVQGMQDGISQAAQDSYRSADKVSTLEARVLQIKKIVDSITAIALRTNMLAVQGAVEAARAGEEGKGFAVVAADIQALADNSGQNAEQIKDLVHEIERQIVVSISDIKDTALMNQHSSLESSKAFDKLNQVNLEFKVVLDEINKVQKNTHDSNEKTSLVYNDMQEVVSRAQDSSEFIDKAKDAATKGNKKIRELSEAVSTIVNLADEVQK